VQFAKYKEMQRILELEKAAWEEQHRGGVQRGFNPAASFNFGAVVGSVRNVLRGVGGSAEEASGVAPGAERTSSQGHRLSEEAMAGVTALDDEPLPPVEHALHPVRFTAHAWRPRGTTHAPRLVRAGSARAAR
jgi:hypothetical protein